MPASQQRIYDVASDKTRATCYKKRISTDVFMMKLIVQIVAVFIL
jgi:hypothetical protein